MTMKNETKLSSMKKRKRSLTMKKKEATLVEDTRIEGRGVVYVKHIPHGFYEKEMREYFKQFGQVTRLRLSRSKKTGGSKGYAFVEFGSEDVAKIAASSMQDYLMFRQRLMCKYIEHSELHQEVFKNAQRMFRPPKAASLARQRQNSARSAGQQVAVALRLRRKNAKRLSALKELGIDYELPDIPKPKEIRQHFDQSAAARDESAKGPSTDKLLLKEKSATLPPRRKKARMEDAAMRVSASCSLSSDRSLVATLDEKKLVGGKVEGFILLTGSSEKNVVVSIGDEGGKSSANKKRKLKTESGAKNIESLPTNTERSSQKTNKRLVLDNLGKDQGKRSELKIKKSKTVLEIVELKDAEAKNVEKEMHGTSSKKGLGAKQKNAKVNVDVRTHSQSNAKKIGDKKEVEVKPERPAGKGMFRKDAKKRKVEKETKVAELRNKNQEPRSSDEIKNIRKRKNSK